MNLIAISTAYRPSPAVRHRCEKSVRNQTVPVQHIYIADEVGGYHLENLYNAVRQLDPADVVLSLDGDDWLLDDHAAEIVQRSYERGAWMTWGQYAQFENGKRSRVGHSHDHKRRRECRLHPWYASHLKTYRAGLFQQIRIEDLQRDGAWLPQCCDLAVMFPLLEMADDRGMFIPQVLYGYDYTDRRARKHDVPGTHLNIEQCASERYLRSRPVYPRLETAPWEKT